MTKMISLLALLRHNISFIFQNDILTVLDKSMDSRLSSLNSRKILI